MTEILSDSSESILKIDKMEKNDKKLIPGLTGLINVGNTCYMNSALQCLSATNLLTAYLIGNRDISAPYKSDLKNAIITEILKEKKCDIKEISDKEIKKQFRESLTYSLRKLMTIYWGVNCKLKPKSFKQTLGLKKKTFQGFNQHDSQECLSFILDKIHDETKTDVKTKFVNLSNELTEYLNYYQEFLEIMKSKDIVPEQKSYINIEYYEKRKNNLKCDAITKFLLYWCKFLRHNHSVIIDIFTGVFFTQIQCNTCDNISFSYSAYNIISLPIKRCNDEITLDSCLEEYFEKHENLCGDNQYSCDFCCTKSDATMKTNLWSAPSRLIIQLKRFGNGGVRINTNVNFPIVGLNMTKYMSPYVFGKHVYDLYGVINHTGNLHFGHYTSYTKNPINDEWYLYDDANILHIGDENVQHKIKTNSAYVLFYKKRGDFELTPSLPS